MYCTKYVHTLASRSEIYHWFLCCVSSSLSHFLVDDHDVDDCDDDDDCADGLPIKTHNYVDGKASRIIYGSPTNATSPPFIREHIQTSSSKWLSPFPRPLLPTVGRIHTGTVSHASVLHRNLETVTLACLQVQLNHLPLAQIDHEPRLSLTLSPMFVSRLDRQLMSSFGLEPQISRRNPTGNPHRWPWPLCPQSVAFSSIMDVQSLQT